MPTSPIPTVVIESLGCRLNEAEAQDWRASLIGQGARVENAPDAPGVVVINTCAVTAAAARKSRQAIRRARREHPDARIVAAGCLCSMDDGAAARAAGADLAVPNALKDDLPAMLGIGAAGNGDAAPPERRRVRRFLKVQDGCRHRCTFCIVARLRPAESSRAADVVVEAVSKAVDEGVREVVLTGVHLGGYRDAAGHDLAALVRRIRAETGIARLRVPVLEPWGMSETLLSAWRDGAIEPHLHLPIQSGSALVLRRMARRSGPEDILRLVDSLRAAVPDGALTTDVIAGFPGETDADWRATVELVARAGFEDVHVFPYSPRRGTPAERLPARVPGEIVRARAAEMRAWAEARRATALGERIGRRAEVLWEGRVEREAGGWRHYGQSPDGRRVSAVLAEPAPGRIDLVEYASARADGCIEGKPLARSAP